MSSVILHPRKVRVRFSSFHIRLTIYLALSLGMILKRTLAASTATPELSASFADSGDSAAAFLAEGIDIKVKQ